MELEKQKFLENEDKLRQMNQLSEQAEKENALKMKQQAQLLQLKDREVELQMAEIKAREEDYQRKIQELEKRHE